MKRPVGVILAAIVLSLFALITLLTAVGSLATALTLRHRTALPPNPQLPPGVLSAIIVGTAFFFLVVAAWFVVTVVGILRLRSWARYSLLVIGGLLTFFGLASAATIALLSASMAQSPQPAMPPGFQHGIIAILALLYAAVAAIGIWWLIYFNFKATKAYFLPLYTAAYGPQTRAPYPYPSAASLATPGGLPYPPPPPLAAAPVTPKAPTAIVIIACLFFLLALLCAVVTFLPLPGFFLGAILTGAPDHILYAILTLVTAAIGFGMLRLDERARLATFFLLGIATVNALLTLTPHFRAQSALYQAMIRDSMHVPPSPIDTNSPYLLVPGIVFSLALYATIAWLLQRHRAAFKP